MSAEDRADPANFKPGVYLHHKGHFYVATKLLRHHETGTLFVEYLSMEYGIFNVREWCTPGADSWTDMVDYRDKFGQLTGEKVPRFKYMRPSHAAY